jgi:hypothetical protein
MLHSLCGSDTSSQTHHANNPIMLPTGTRTCHQALCRALANGFQACQIYKHWCRACKALRCWQWTLSIIICIHTWALYACCSFQPVSASPTVSTQPGTDCRQLGCMLTQHRHLLHSISAILWPASRYKHTKQTVL